MIGTATTTIGTVSLPRPCALPYALLVEHTQPLTPKRCTLTHQHACARGMLKHARAHLPDYLEDQEQPSIHGRCLTTPLTHAPHNAALGLTRAHTPPTPSTGRSRSRSPYGLYQAPCPHTKLILIAPRALPQTHAHTHYLIRLFATPEDNTQPLASLAPYPLHPK